MFVGLKTEPNDNYPQRTPFSVIDNSQFHSLSSLNLLLLAIENDLPMVTIPLLKRRAGGVLDNASVRRIFWETKLLSTVLGGKLALH